jgi:internalin A
MTTPVVPQPQLQTGGALIPGQHLYIQRPADDLLLKLLRQGEYCNILASRQTGKSSLMMQAVALMSAEGFHVATPDVSVLGNPPDADSWYQGLLQEIAGKINLNLNVDVEAWWHHSKDSTPNQRLLRFLREEVVAKLSGQIIIFLDEIDSTLKLSYTDDFFTAIRAMYNQRSKVRAYRQITFCLVGVATPNELIKDKRTTPYNIGKTIELNDFDSARDDLRPLFRVVSDDDTKGEAIVRAVLEHTGGHPYLTAMVCEKFREHGLTASDDVEGLISELFVGFDAIRHDTHFEQVLRFIDERVEDKLVTLELYRSIRNGESVYDQTVSTHIALKLAGIVKRDRRGMLVVRNPIYYRLFTDEWAVRTAEVVFSQYKSLMLEKRAVNARGVEDTRTAGEIAEEQIAEWKRNPKKISVLSLNGLGMTKVPEALREVRDLELLTLSANKIQELPEWIGELSALKAIDLNQNNLRTLPPAIGSLRSLAGLYLSKNQLETLPETLHTLPLKELDLHANPALGLPDSILNRPAEAILRYYFESRNEKGHPLLELKLILVGRGGAGKTTLVKRLAGEAPNAHEPETHSIVIRELTLASPRGQVRTRVWDFGGQEILHATHQFFLTERSLYLIVLEPRSGLAQRDAEYWLKLIEMQGGASPVIMVLNWSHGRRWRVDEVRLRRRFPFIVTFLSTDALHGDGIEELHHAISQAVEERMRDVWIPFPQRWREIKDAIAGIHNKFLTYSQYSELCAQYGEKDPAAQADLAGVLHALGLVLYFGKDLRLHNTLVLNPGWVTGGVYAVVRAPSVAANDGRLAVRDMPRVLREAEKLKVLKAADYPPETHQFVLELMRAFQLCYASEEEQGKPGRYLVPELLPEFEPEMAEPWEQAPVRLRYRYEVLPPGLLPRFIVRTHALSDGAPHWRHGVVLRHAEVTALIRAETDRPELYAFVLGGDDETRRVLVAMVRRELESLHGELKMQPVEELELTGEEEHWISVKALREVEQPDTPTQKLPIQPEGTAEVNVLRELDKLLPAEAREIERNTWVAPVPVRVFVSYAHDDERQLKRLDAMLDVLEQYHGLTPWQDKRLIAGDEWNDEIRRRLEDMDIFLFIASQTSLMRPYIKDPELRRARERYTSGEVEIVVVKLEPFMYDDDPFLGKLQRLAPRFSSIAEVSPRSKAWEQVRKDLLTVIQRVRKRKEGVTAKR